MPSTTPECGHDTRNAIVNAWYLIILLRAETRHLGSLRCHCASRTNRDGRKATQATARHRRGADEPLRGRASTSAGLLNRRAHSGGSIRCGPPGDYATDPAVEQAVAGSEASGQA